MMLLFTFKVIFGGGRRNFVLKSESGKRNDEDLTEKYQRYKQDSSKSYRYIKTKADLHKWSSDGMTDYVLGRAHLHTGQ